MKLPWLESQKPFESRDPFMCGGKKSTDALDRAWDLRPDLSYEKPEKGHLLQPYRKAADRNEKIIC